MDYICFCAVKLHSAMYVDPDIQECSFHFHREIMANDAALLLLVILN